MHQQKMEACVVGTSIHVFQMNEDYKTPTQQTDKGLYLCTTL